MTTLLILAATLAGALVFIAVPLRQPAAPRRRQQAQRARELREESEELRRLLHDLEFDRNVGKLEEAEFQAAARELGARLEQVEDQVAQLYPPERIERLVEEELKRVRSELKKASTGR